MSEIKVEKTTKVTYAVSWGDNPEEDFEVFSKKEPAEKFFFNKTREDSYNVQLLELTEIQEDTYNFLDYYEGENAAV